jgi:hypothetical protein
MCAHAVQNTLVESISTEESYVLALEKLATACHTSPTPDLASNLFSSSYTVITQEGATLSKAWQAMIMEVQRVSYLRKVIYYFSYMCSSC